MSLYYYVRTKAELVALMDDALMGQMLVAEGKLPRRWRAAISTIARRTREVFVRHPWALQAMQGAPPGPNAMRHFEQCLEALEDAPLSHGDKLALLQLVDDFVFGHSLRATEAKTWLSDDSNPWRSAEALSHQLCKTGAFPRTAALLARASPQDRARQWLPEGRFERALAAVLDGAAERFARNVYRGHRASPRRVRRASPRNT